MESIVDLSSTTEAEAAEMLQLVWRTFKCTQSYFKQGSQRVDGINVYKHGKTAQHVAGAPASCSTFKEVTIDIERAKEEGVVVVSDHPVYKALCVEPRTLRLRLGGGYYVRDAKILQQLLAVSAQQATDQCLCCLLDLSSLQDSDAGAANALVALRSWSGTAPTTRPVMAKTMSVMTKTDESRCKQALKHMWQRNCKCARTRVQPMSNIKAFNK